MLAMQADRGENREVSVQVSIARCAEVARACCLAALLVGCGGEVADGTDAGARDAALATDAAASGAAEDASTTSEADAGESPDAATGEQDAGPPEPTCEPVACDSVSGTTPEGRLASVDACAFALRLERPLAEGEALADRLLARLGAGRRRDLDDVRADLNRSGRAGLGSEASARLAGLGATGFRWNTGDESVDYWYPQGITGSADAGDAGSLLMVSWYHRTDARPTKGARISVVDVSDLSQPRYRHLLLVDPVETAEGADFGPAEYDSGGALHAGGITWIGDRLYVADTSQGLRVYDLSRMFAPTNADDTERVGIAGARSDAHGYAYAVPRVARYVRAAGACSVRFSFVARGDVGGEPALITGEYVSDSPNGRLVAWPLDVETGLLAGPGTTYASAAAIGGQTRVQGALRAGDTWYMSSSSQGGSSGRLYVARAGSASTSVPWIRGCEDLYLDAADRLWTAGEHPGARDVVSIPRP